MERISLALGVKGLSNVEYAIHLSALSYLHVFVLIQETRNVSRSVFPKPVQEDPLPILYVSLIKHTQFSSCSLYSPADEWNQVLDKGDIQKVQARGSTRTGLGSTGLDLVAVTTNTTCL